MKSMRQLISHLTTTEDSYLYRDELVTTFLSVAVSQIQNIPLEKAAALVHW